MAAANYRKPEGDFVIKKRTPMNLSPALVAASEFGRAQTLFNRNFAVGDGPVKDSRIVAANALRRFLFNTDLATAPDGIYTWIIKEIGSASGAGPVLVAAPTLTKQEIGSLHANLDGLTADGTVIAAGEVRKTGVVAEYNISSGTYMGELFVDIVWATRKAAGGGRVFKKDITTFSNAAEVAAAVAARVPILAIADATFTVAGLTPIFLEIAGDHIGHPIADIAGQPIIEPATIVLNNAELFGLYRAGLKEIGWPPASSARKSGGARRRRRTRRLTRGRSHRNSAHR